MASGLLGQLADSLLPGRGKGPADRRRTLALTPVRNPHVEWTADGKGFSQTIQITIPLQKRPVPKPLIWFASKLARRQPPDTKSLQLDPVGSFVWRSLDGRTTVRQLIWLLAAAYQLNRREAELSLIEFLRNLSLRNLAGFAHIPEQKF